MDHLIPARRLDQVMIKKKEKKWTYRIVDFRVLVNYWVKMKENKKKDKYLDLDRDKKKKKKKKEAVENEYRWY